MSTHMKDIITNKITILISGLGTTIAGITISDVAAIVGTSVTAGLFIMNVVRLEREKKAETLKKEEARLRIEKLELEIAKLQK